MGFMRMRLSTQLTVLTGGIMLLTMSLLVILLIVQIRQALFDPLEQRVRVTAEAYADVLGNRSSGFSLDETDIILGATVQQRLTDSVAIYNNEGLLVLMRGNALAPAVDERAEVLARQVRTNGIGAGVWRGGLFLFATPIRSEAGVRGTLVVLSQADGPAGGLAGIAARMLAVGLGLALAAVLAVALVVRRVGRPLRALAQAATALGQGTFEAVPTTNRGGEIGDLERAFAQMARNILVSRSEAETQQADLERRVAVRTAELEHTVAELRGAMAVREQLSMTIRAMSSPVVPVLEGILVMPLIGVFDPQRIQSMLDALLGAIERHRAAIVIVDVTGVPLVDTQVARTLLQAERAARLLGARTVLVGLRPEVAQTIVGLGLDLSGIVARADLQGGVEYAMRQRRVSAPHPPASSPTSGEGVRLSPSPAAGRGGRG